LSGLGAGILKQSALGVPSLAAAGSDFVGGQTALITQYAVPYVSASGVLAESTTLFQCPSGVVGIGGCTSSYPGFKVSSGTLHLRQADDSTVAATVGGNFSFSGRTYSTLQTVTYSATPAFHAGLSNNFKLTLTGNVTSSTLNWAAVGQIINFVICQDSTGGRTFAWPLNVKGGMTIGATASTCSAQQFICDGTNAYALSTGVSGM
jgi:hypothetical protein